MHEVNLFHYTETIQKQNSNRRKSQSIILAVLSRHSSNIGILLTRKGILSHCIRSSGKKLMIYFSGKDSLTLTQRHQQDLRSIDYICITGNPASRKMILCKEKNVYHL